MGNSHSDVDVVIDSPTNKYVHYQADDQKQDIKTRKGWMEKESRHRKQWRKRWVVLEKYTIYTFKNKTDSKSEATEIIDLHNALCVEREQSHINSYCFELYCDNNVSFKFKASTENEMNLWIKDIESQLNKTYYLDTKHNHHDNDEEKYNTKQYGEHEFDAEEKCSKCGIYKINAFRGIIKCHLDIGPKHIGALKPAHDGKIVKYHPNPQPIPKHSGYLSIKYHKNNAYKLEHFSKYISYHNKQHIYIHSTSTYPAHAGKLINYHPDTFELYHPQQLQPFHPQKKESYHPQNKEWYHPKETEWYHPQFNDRYHTGYKQIYHPKSLIYYHPSKHEAYHSMHKESYHPEGIEWYHPEGIEWYHYGSKQQYHPQSLSNYHPGHHELYHKGYKRKCHSRKLEGYHPSSTYSRRVEYTSYNYLYIPVKIEWNHQNHYIVERDCCGAEKNSAADIYRGCKTRWSCCYADKDDTGCQYLWSCCDKDEDDTGCEERWSCCWKKSYYETGCVSKYKCCVKCLIIFF